MDAAVALVQTYLRVNGYFTVTEFPVVEMIAGADYRVATDLDLLATRFPEATRRVVHDGPEARARVLAPLDPVLAVPDDSVDMIVGEVKESLAEFNPAGLRKDVLEAALDRFGCCGPDDHSAGVVARLLSHGRAKTAAGHLVRLVAFGAKAGPGGPYLQIGLDRVIGYLETYVRENWDVLRHTESKDPVLSFMMLRQKAGGDGGFGE